MGVNTRVYLPPRARVRDVAMVAGALAGLKPERYHIEGSKGVFVKVPYVTVKPCGDGLPECAFIQMDGDMVDGQPQHQVMYHFETETGERLMCPRSTPFWIAVMRRVVDFFGGRMSYMDCEEKEEPDHTAPSPMNIHPTDGEEWDRFQLAILDLKPVSREEIKDAVKHAAYK